MSRPAERRPSSQVRASRLSPEAAGRPQDAAPVPEHPGIGTAAPTASRRIVLPPAGPGVVEDGPLKLGRLPHPRSAEGRADRELRRRIAAARRAADADALGFELWRQAGYAGHRLGS